MTVFVNFAPIVTGVGSCVQTGLAADSIGGVPANMRIVPLYPGRQIPWDECQCGQLALAITRVYGSDVFPNVSTGHNQKSCGPQMQVAEVVVQVARCVPGPDTNGEPPAPADLYAAALSIESDRAAVLAALACCLETLYGQRRLFAWAIGESATVGDLGGCVATETTFYLGLRNCLCGGT